MFSFAISITFSFKFLLIVPWKAVFFFFALSVGLGGSISQLASVWQYCLAIIRCFRMNGIDPLLTTFVSYCVRGCSRGGQTCESGCLILFFITMTSAFVSRHPGNVTPHYSTLRCFRKCPLFSLLFFFFLKLTQNCSWSPPAIKDTSDWGTVHKCNAIWLIPTFVRVSTNDQT